MDLYCEAADLESVARFGVEFRLRPGEAPDEHAGLHLRYGGGVLALARGNDTRGVFVARPDVERRVSGAFALGRACGIRRDSPIDILDATAGLGLDGLALAVAGQRVVLAERVAALWAMLVNLIERLSPVEAEARWLDCAELLSDRVTATGGEGSHGESIFDVVYLDPMFPTRNKSALPGKRMQLVGALLEGEKPFDLDLLEAARWHARQRVVLKRRLKDPVCFKPDWQIKGRTVRYDVYTGRAGREDQPSCRTA